MKLFALISLAAGTAFAQVPEGFSDVSKINPRIQVEMRYFTGWNFMGRPVAGYQANKCYLTTKAAQALSRVQKTLEADGYSLLVFDCYRPQKAVDDFVAWTKDSRDQAMRDIFYPDEPKGRLVERGYIADKSGHSRGSTVDLTVIRKKFAGDNTDGRLRFQEEAVDCRNQKKIEETGQIDMGTTFDCFSARANTNDAGVTPVMKQNRLRLMAAMEKHGFTNYAQEWWHFTLKSEPFKDKFFDFDVK